jgi:hypothetical protein
MDIASYEERSDPESLGMERTELQEVTSFSRAFFLVVVHNGGWGVLYDVRVYSFPWLSAPFIFIITYKVCCFQICCVVLQVSYL